MRLQFASKETPRVIHGLLDRNQLQYYHYTGGEFWEL
jgi:hypothetical protein